MKKRVNERISSQDEKSLAATQAPHSLQPVYEPPVTTRTVVETEGSFCSSIVPDEPDTEQQNISITPQDFGVQSNYDTDPNTGDPVEGGGWDF